MKTENEKSENQNEEVKDELKEESVDTKSTEEATAEIVEPEAKEEVVEKIVEVNVDYKDKYLRLLAEFENARKRMDREKSDFIKYANEDMVVDVLAILDDLERTVTAFKNAPDDKDALQKGMDMVLKSVNEILKKNDVVALETQGQVFDPNSSEVLMQEPSEEYDEGVVIEEFQKGYKFGDRIVRTAKVKVAAKKE